MKGMYWNRRGLSDLTKFRYVSDANNHLDFLAIM